MNNIIRILILAIIGGLIGYITNVIAIKLIFRPINPIKIPILNIEIIGMIPKRKTEIATNIAKVVEEQFISVDEITDNIITEQDGKEYPTQEQYTDGKIIYYMEDFRCYFVFA